MLTVFSPLPQTLFIPPSFLSQSTSSVYASQSCLPLIYSPFCYQTFQSILKQKSCPLSVTSDKVKLFAIRFKAFHIWHLLPSLYLYHSPPLTLYSRKQAVLSSFSHLWASIQNIPSARKDVLFSMPTFAIFIPTCSSEFSLSPQRSLP